MNVLSIKFLNKYHKDTASDFPFSSLYKDKIYFHTSESEYFISRTAFRFCLSKVLKVRAGSGESMESLENIPGVSTQNIWWEVDVWFGGWMDR